MNKPKLYYDKAELLFDNKYLKIYGLEYIEGRQYMNASRRPKSDLPSLKNDEEFKKMIPDAVSCVVILNEEEPKLLLSYEFRYPVGQFVFSVPAGLIDAKDKENDNPVISAAIRELKEEINAEVSQEDKISIINPLLFSSPGMTDESNALVCVVIEKPEKLNLNQDGAEDTECFDGYEAISIEKATELVKKGVDDNGNFYSVYTFMALMYFISGMWKQA